MHLYDCYLYEFWFRFSGLKNGLALFVTDECVYIYMYIHVYIYVCMYICVYI